MNTHEFLQQIQSDAESRRKGNSMPEAQTTASRDLPAMNQDEPASASRSQPEESAFVDINKFQSTPELRVFFQLLKHYDFDTGDDLGDPNDVMPMQWKWQTSPYASRIDQLLYSNPKEFALLLEIIDVGIEAGASAWLTDAAKVAAVSGEIGNWMQEKEAELGVLHPFAE